MDYKYSLYGTADKIQDNINAVNTLRAFANKYYVNVDWEKLRRCTTFDDVKLLLTEDNWHFYKS